MVKLKDTLAAYEEIPIAEEVPETQSERNFDRIYKTISGAWFSFGDERFIKEAFTLIASTPEGQEILHNLSRNVEIESTHFMDNDMRGSHFPETGDISLNTSIINSNDADVKLRQQINPSSSRLNVQTILTLFHELRHANQTALGLDLTNTGASVEQKITAGKLMEAETRSWDRVNRITYMYIDNFSFGSRQNVPGFKNYDFVENARQNHLRQNKPFDEAAFKEKYKDALELQRNLRKYGDVDKAQRAMVGSLMKEYMKSDPDKHIDPKWQYAYDQQAVGNAIYSASKGRLTAQGNMKQYNKMLMYYQNKYGIKRSDISRTGLGPAFNEVVQTLKKTIHQYPVHSPAYAKGIKQTVDLFKKVTQKNHDEEIDQFETKVVQNLKGLSQTSYAPHLSSDSKAFRPGDNLKYPPPAGMAAAFKNRGLGS